jgi:hypothetical protein
VATHGHLPSYVNHHPGYVSIVSLSSVAPTIFTGKLVAQAARLAAVPRLLLVEDGWIMDVVLLASPLCRACSAPAPSWGELSWIFGITRSRSGVLDKSLFQEIITASVI